VKREEAEKKASKEAQEKEAKKKETTEKEAKQAVKNVTNGKGNATSTSLLP